MYQTDKKGSTVMMLLSCSISFIDSKFLISVIQGAGAEVMKLISLVISKLDLM